MWELFMCVSMMWGLCGHVRVVEFDNKAECVEQQKAVTPQLALKNGYAVCRPKVEISK